MANRSRRVTVEFLGDSRSLKRAADSAEKSTGRLGSVFGRVGKAAALGLAGGLVVAGKAMWDMVEAAAEDEQSQRRLATTLRNTTRATNAQIASVEDWITAQGEAFGVADDQLRPALEKLATATGSVAKAQKLARLAMDVSAGTGRDLGAVTAALTRAYNGSTGALGKLGIQTKNAKGEALSFDQITSKLSQTFRGQAQVQAETTAGKFQRLKLKLSEAGEAIGAKLLPKLLEFANWIDKKGWPALDKFQKKAGPAFRGLLSAVRDMWRVVGPILGWLIKRIGDALRLYQALEEMSNNGGNLGAGAQGAINQGLSSNNNQSQNHGSPQHRMVAGASAASSEQTVVINFNIDGHPIHQALLKVKRQGGGLELGLA